LTLTFVALLLVTLADPAAGGEQDLEASREAAPPAAAAAGASEQSDQSGATPAELAEMPLVGEYGNEVEQRWRAFLEANGLQEGVNPNDYFLSSGTEIVTFDKGIPGWIEARRIAFELAQVRAKARMIGYLAQKVKKDLEAPRSEYANFEQGYTEELERLDQASRILRKMGDFTEAALDEAIGQLNPKYDPERYKGKDSDEKELVLEQLYQENLNMAASRLLIGALTYHVIEGPTASGSHEILVGVIWTPNLARLGAAIDDQHYAMPLEEAGDYVRNQLPDTVGKAIASLGTRVFVNEKGQRALLAYGQAEPANVVGSLERDLALRAAIDRAENNATGAIASFVGEKVTFRDSTASEALTRVYAGLGQRGSTIDSRSIRNITAATREVTLKGVGTVWQQIVKHPETGQEIAIVARMWSPEGLGTAIRMQDVIDGVQQNEPKSTAREKGPEKRKEPLVLERRANDPRAF
jgi:hypothetical protein